MPFESAVLVDHVCWQMKASSISARLRPDPGMALRCMTMVKWTVGGCAMTQQRPKMLMLPACSHIVYPVLHRYYYYYYYYYYCYYYYYYYYYYIVLYNYFKIL